MLLSLWVQRIWRAGYLLFGFGGETMSFADFPKELINLQFMVKTFTRVECKDPHADLRQNAPKQIPGYSKIAYGVFRKTVDPGQISAPIEVVCLESLFETHYFNWMVNDGLGRIENLTPSPKQAHTKLYLFAEHGILSHFAQVGAKESMFLKNNFLVRHIGADG
jgi:hypothetical protein